MVGAVSSVAARGWRDASSSCPTRAGDPTLDPTRSSSFPPSRPPGLREQFGATRDSAYRLAMAHIELAKAELSAIGGEIARAAALGGIAVAVVRLAAILFVVGTALVTSEWLLGSMGWGILHGVLLFAGIATACALSIVGMSGGRIGRWLALAAVIGILVSIVFALDLPNQLYTAIGDNFVTSIEPGVRPLVVGLVLWGVIGLLVGVGLAFRLTSAGSRFGAIVGLAIAGAAFGAFTAITFSVQVGVGIGAAVGWACWTALMAADISRTGVDVEALKARFTPTRTIETSKETLEWLQSKMPPGIGS